MRGRIETVPKLNLISRVPLTFELPEPILPQSITETLKHPQSQNLDSTIFIHHIRVCVWVKIKWSTVSGLPFCSVTHSFASEDSCLFQMRVTTSAFLFWAFLNCWECLRKVFLTPLLDLFPSYVSPRHLILTLSYYLSIFHRVACTFLYFPMDIELYEDESCVHLSVPRT